MPTCNLAEMVYKKWLQQSSNKMTCFNKAIVDDIFCALMQISKYMSWLKGGSTHKGHDSMSLKIKVVARTEDPKLPAEIYELLPKGRRC